jgi:hypothetical protein
MNNVKLMMEKFAYGYSGGEGTVFFNPKTGELIITVDGLYAFKTEDSEYSGNFTQIPFNYEEETTYESHSMLSAEGYIYLPEGFQEIKGVRNRGGLKYKTATFNDKKWILAYERKGGILEGLQPPQPLFLISKEYFNKQDKNIEVYSFVVDKGGKILKSKHSEGLIIKGVPIFKDYPFLQNDFKEKIDFIWLKDKGIVLVDYTNPFGKFNYRIYATDRITVKDKEFKKYFPIEKAVSQFYRVFKLD